MFYLCLPSAEATSLDDSLQSRELKVPGGKVLGRSEVKLDYCMSGWYRMELKMYRAHRYLTMDASPKAGYQILGGTQQYIPWPRQLSFEDQVHTELRVDRRYFPLATLPYGEFSVYEKACRVQHWVRMESGDVKEDFDQCRHEVRECGTDQGTEKGINNIANVHVPSVLEAIRRVQGGVAVAHEPDTASVGFLFPFSLWLGDHLHMIFGTLEEAVGSLDNWSGEFETMLQDFSEFMNNGPLRRRFSMHCLPTL